ncbi:hypothetical protein [Apilactobacillus nanyangensis]|uniref:hypothetical protein n=1 Tax=Apilactobacillus nanyangensis TaxID=2799579 RepID=UPI0019412745|nr:hypothetical protein [Apilactobacillus nanyangensis]
MKDKLITTIKGLIIALLCAIILYYLKLFLNSDSSQQLSSLTSIISIFVSAIFVVYQVNKSHENAIKEFKITETQKLEVSIKEELVQIFPKYNTTFDSYSFFIASANEIINKNFTAIGFVGEEELQESIKNLSKSNSSKTKEEISDSLSQVNFECDNFRNSLNDLRQKLTDVSITIHTHKNLGHPIPATPLIKECITSIDETQNNITLVRIGSARLLKSSTNANYYIKLKRLIASIGEEYKKIDSYIDNMKKYVTGEDI